MPEEESESRTAMMGRRVPAPALSTGTSTPSTPASTSNLQPSTSPPHSKSGKKKRRQKKKPKGGPDMGANLSQFSLPEPSSLSDPPTTNTATTSNPNQQNESTSSNSMQPPTMNLGNNRLLTGFKQPQQSAQSDEQAESPVAASPGDTEDTAIELSSDESDEEMEGSEGGMVVNLEQSVPRLLANGHALDNDMDTESDNGEPPVMLEDTTRTVNPFKPSEDVSPSLRLLDLSPDDLEDQLTYGLYHLDRTQVDLNRLVVCLSCMGPGHLASDCPLLKCTSCGDSTHASVKCPVNHRCTHCRDKGHTAEDCTQELKINTTPCDVCGVHSHVVQECPQRHFNTVPLSGPVKLWVSCANCASKSHLVGDCPAAHKDVSEMAWSLKALDPDQITNLSLQTGTRKLEKEAETRGMRPPGLTIKGRSGFHQAGVAPPSAPGDEEDFLRPSVPRGKPAMQMGNYQIQRPSPQRPQSERYDRFDAPSFDNGGSSRNRGDSWYNTDSFGRRRSRSPIVDSYRPFARRSPSPRRFGGRAQQNDRYPRDTAIDSYRPNANLPQRPPPSFAPPPSMQLPTRKGSNPNLPARPPSTSLRSTAPMKPHPSGNQQSNARGGKKKNKRGSIQA
jgi:hypothetical protein